MAIETPAELVPELFNVLQWFFSLFLVLAATAEIDIAELPALSKKKQVAKWVGTTERNIELQVHAGKFPPPIRIGKAPRWRRSDLLEWLDDQAGK